MQQKILAPYIISYCYFLSKEINVTVRYQMRISNALEYVTCPIVHYTDTLTKHESVNLAMSPCNNIFMILD